MISQPLVQSPMILDTHSLCPTDISPDPVVNSSIFITYKTDTIANVLTYVNSL